jgi:hypothetical protein
VSEGELFACGGVCNCPSDVYNDLTSLPGGKAPRVERIPSRNEQERLVVRRIDKEVAKD